MKIALVFLLVLFSFAKASSFDQLNDLFEMPSYEMFSKKLEHVCRLAGIQRPGVFALLLPEALTGSKHPYGFSYEIKDGIHTFHYQGQVKAEFSYGSRLIVGNISPLNPNADCVSFAVSFPDEDHFIEQYFLKYFNP